MTDVPDLFEAAVQRHAEGRVADAAALYAKFLEQVPDHADALHLRGMALYQLERPADGARCIRAALAIQPERADFHSNLGLVLKASGEFREAIDAFSQALALMPGNPDYMSNMATAYLAAGQVSDATDVLRRLVETRPDYADGHNNLAVTCMAAADFETAKRHLERALELRPGYVDAMVNLGRLHARQHRHALAAEAFRRVLDTDDSNAELLRDYADALMKSDQLAESQAVVDRLLGLAPDDPESLVTAGNLRQALRDFEAAETCYRRALEIDDKNVRASNNLGTLYVRRGEFEIALTWFLAAIAADPDFVEALFNAGSASQQAGNLEAAEQFYRDALARRPDLPRAYRYLAEVYRSQGRTAELIEVLRTWSRRYPDSASARHMLAACGAADAPQRASDDYIREEFDDFADQFDETLARLRYRTPQMLSELVARTAEVAGARILDAGCGTGLCGPLLQSPGRHICGVDLSGKMLQQAAERNVYDELVESELTTFMQSRPAAFDIVVSADTLVYFGALAEVCGAAATTLVDGGWFAFSVEALVDGEAGAYRLGGSGRYQHAEPYVRQCLADAGFTEVAVEHASLRLETNVPVEGLLVIARSEGTR